jgi:predicted O-linked N-acetylglucosamine transferase (SPINDLY family)
MGVPVVVLAGGTHRSRVGVSLLANVGLPELIAETPQDYVRLAVELAADHERLRRLRAGLRDQVARSPLVEARGFTRRLEEAYQGMWRRWTERQNARCD